MMATTRSDMAGKPPQSRHVGRIIVLIGLSVIGFVALTLALLPYLVSLESVKERIVTQIETALQREMDIGAIHLQILSGLGVGLEEVTVYNPPGWQHPHVLQVDTLSVKVAWRPLLQRRLEVTKVILSDGDIIIERDAEGRLNIDEPSRTTPAPTNAPPGVSQPTPSSSETQPEGHPPADLSISEVTLQDMTIAFVDHGAAPDKALTTTMSDVRLDLRDVAQGTPIPFDLAATVLTDRQQNLRATGRVGPLPPNSAAGGMPVEVHLQVSDILVSQLTPYLDAALPLIQGRIGADVRVQGHVGGNLDMQGALSMADAVLQEAGGQPTALPPVATTYDMALDMANGQLQLTEAVVNLSSLRAAVSGTVHDLLSTPQFDLRLMTNHFAPGELLTDLPRLASAVPPPTDLHGTVQLQATLRGQRQGARVDAQVDLREVVLKSGTFNGGRAQDGGIRLETDEAQAMVMLHVEQPHPPQVHMDVRAQRLVFDQQAARAAAAESPPGPIPGPGGETPPTKPLQMPLTLDAQVHVAEAHIQGVQVQEMTADVSLSNGLLTSKQQGRVYAGSYQADVQANLAQEAPQYALNARLLELNVGQALNELTSIDNAVFGILNSDLQLSGQGFTWDLISQTLTGEGDVRISEAKLTTLDIMPKLVQVLRGVGAVAGITIPAEWEHLSFNAVESSLRLHQGKIFSDALKLRGQGIEAILNGAIGLDQSLDYAGTVFLPGKSVGERGPLTLLRRDDKGRILVPFAVRGTINAPQIAFDERLFRDVVGDAWLDKVREQLGGIIGGSSSAPSTGGGQEQPSEQTGREAGPPQTRDLPRKILEELFRR